ncbi:DUF5672 family protein [Variovorax sp. PvP013]|uniref:DUF5672 family protein n=1 Tax=Variovorax sp. PvP013 TaxID=3156435 RepID=UPI003D1B69A7
MIKDDLKPIQRLVTVVIPVCTPEPTALGRVSLAQTLAVLGRHPITFVVPSSLDVQWYEEFCQDKAEIRFERFEWKNGEDFYEITLSSRFFERFKNYDYILTCRLDAFVFKDDLAAWCHQGYDYIGSVIPKNSWEEEDIILPRRNSRFLKIVRSLLRTRPTAYLTYGDFSLKRVSTFLEMTRIFKPYINFYKWTSIVRGKILWESLFVMRHFPRLSRNFVMPPREIAERFSTEYMDYDERGMLFDAKGNDELPFGSHGWSQFQSKHKDLIV